MAGGSLTLLRLVGCRTGREVGVAKRPVGAVAAPRADRSRLRK